MTSIATKRGAGGQTGLAVLRVETYGTVEEPNSVLGVALREMNEKAGPKWSRAW